MERRTGKVHFKSLICEKLMFLGLAGFLFFCQNIFVLFVVKLILITRG